MGRLDGKVIVLSAAAQGIGRATALVSENSTTCIEGRGHLYDVVSESSK